MIYCSYSLKTTSNVGTTSMLVLSSNGKRRGLFILNDGGTKAFVTLGAVSSTSDFTFFIPPNEVYPMLGPSMWIGEIYAIRASGSAKLIITELFHEQPFAAS